MTSSNTISRRTLASASAMASMLLVGGCMSSPTYGTDKTAGAQLLSDVSNITKLSPERKERIAYKPRPELVKPDDARTASLPQPQQSVADASNPDWIESPEERRNRIRGESDKANDAGAFQGAKGAIRNEEIEAPISTTAAYDDAGKVGQSARYRPGTDPVGQKARSAEIQRRIKENNQGSATSRRYLSEPPIAYREPAADAAVGELGEDESVKERRIKAEARKKSGKTSWRDYVPGF